MADNTTLNSGTGGDTIASDDVLGVKYQRVKISVGADGAAADNGTTAPLAVKISDGTDVALVTAGGLLQVDASGVAVPITDNSGSITVDGTVAVSGTVTVDSELTTADLDTGAGTDTRAVVGLVGAKSGGGVLIPGDATKGLAVDLTATGANATALKVDGSAVTQPVSAASLPLPTGAATAAKQPALGTAGTASADVLTVQGITSMTALKVDGSGVTQPVSGTVAVSGAVDTELTTADLDTGAGTDTRAVVGLVLAESGGGLLVGSAHPVPISDNAGSLTVDNGGTFAVQAAQSGTWTVQPGNTANTTAWKVDASSVAVPITDNSGSLTVDNAGTFAVQVKPTTSGGLSMASGTIGATKTAIKASAGQLYGYYIYNANASVVYVQVFNAASASVTLGTTAPDLSLGIPATSAANVEFTNGIAFGTAITIAITTTRSGSTGPGSTVDYNIFYA